MKYWAEKIKPTRIRLFSKDSVELIQLDSGDICWCFGDCESYDILLSKESAIEALQELLIGLRRIWNAQDRRCE